MYPVIYQKKLIGVLDVEVRDCELFHIGIKGIALRVETSTKHVFLPGGFKLHEDVDVLVVDSEQDVDVLKTEVPYFFYW